MLSVLQLFLTKVCGFVVESRVYVVVSRVVDLFAVVAGRLILQGCSEAKLQVISTLCSPVIDALSSGPCREGGCRKPAMLKHEKGLHEGLASR